MIVGVLTTCHTQYTYDSSICIFLFNRTTLQVFVTYLTGALYVHAPWFYKHQHDNRVRSKLFVACQRWCFQWWFWFLPSVPGYLREEEIHRCNYLLLSQVYCVWHVVKTPTTISNDPVHGPHLAFCRFSLFQHCSKFMRSRDVDRNKSTDLILHKPRHFEGGQGLWRQTSVFSSHRV